MSARVVKPRKTGMKSSHYTTVVLPPCKICDGEATGFHFGVITCEACKAFYRRALVQKKPPTCKKNNICEISSERTGNCAACRLRKCKENGMSKEGIRRGRFSLPLRTRAILEANSLEGKSPHHYPPTTTQPPVTKPLVLAPSSIQNQPSAIQVTAAHLPTITSSAVQQPVLIQSSTVIPLNTQTNMSSFCNMLSDENNSSGVSMSADDSSCSFSPFSDFSCTDDSDWSDPCSLTDSVCPSFTMLTSVSSALLPMREPPSVSPTSSDDMSTSGASADDNWLVPSARASPVLQMSPDAGLGLVKCSEFEFLIDSLVSSQELVYPLLKKYFEQPLDLMHKNNYLELNRKQAIFNDVFGESGTVSTADYLDVFAETGLDIDERLQQFNKYGLAMEDSIKQYMKFAEIVPGFYKLDKDDVANLAKSGHLEFWFFGSHMLFNKELGVAMSWDGSQNGKREHMTKFFDEEWIDQNFEFADTLNKLNLTFEEIALIRAIILTSADRGRLNARTHIHSLQERYFECLRYYLWKNKPQSSKRLYKLIDRLCAVRNMSHVNIRVNRKFLNDWGFIMQDYPLWREMISCDEI